MTIGRIIDVSSNNHGNLPPGQGRPINWTAVARAGVTAVFIKATEGLGYFNPWFTEDARLARAAGIAVLGYHFAGGGNAAAEAAFFLSKAGGYARVLDYETRTDVQWARGFLLELNRPPDELLTYGSASTFRSFYAQLPSMAWVAAYQEHYPGWGVCWQFTDAATIPGIAGQTDENRWYGSEDQYGTLFQITQQSGDETMLAPTPTGNGYWTVNAQGAVITHGDAQYLGGPNTSQVDGKWGGPPVLAAGRVVTSIVAHPSAQGYWIEDNIGEVFAYGAAQYHPPN